jgi:hypothetical protein
MTRPTADEKIWEALEVCRPDRDELPDPALSRLVGEMAAHPELCERYERIQGFDAQLGDLFREVPIPPALDERIKSAIESTFHSEKIAIPPQAGVKINLSRRRMTFRRWLFVAGGLLTSAAALMVVLYWGMRKTESYTLETACGEAIRFFELDDAPPGTLLEKQEPPEDFALSRALIPQRGIRWRKISNFLARDGIAFDLPCREGIRATLYVVQHPFDGIPWSPSLSPSFTTSGCAAFVWREDGSLYICVVRGDPHTFRNLLILPRSPLA